MRDELFHLRHDGEATLQAQLRQMLVSAILQGQIPKGEPLPSCRRLAQILSVARNTVTLAYQDLAADGFLIARERRGYFVNEEILEGRASGITAAPAHDTGAPDWDSRFQVTPSRQRNIVKPQNWQSYPYPFIYGQFDPALFPIADWRQCSRQALSVEAVRDWASDSFTEDDPLLVEQIRTRLLPRRGIRVSPDEILVTVGAQHALYLLASLLMGAETTIGFEDPGYVDARNIFALKTDRIRPLPVDAQGLVADEALDGCDYVYVTPSHQFPTTATMTLERRMALLDRARRADFIVIEDDYDSEINHIGSPTAALKSIDASGRVIFLASLSKTLAPGLRLGYMVGPKALIAELRALRRLMLRHPPMNNQRTLATFLALGHHDSLIRRLSHAYRDRWEVMRTALERHLPTCSFYRATGGTAYWVAGPPGLDTALVAQEAAKRGVLIEPGAIHFMSKAPSHYFRLGFSSIPVNRIEPGLSILGEIIDACSKP
jgi:GntR family transcriptional regulator / MocR family aminotransferase